MAANDDTPDDWRTAREMRSAPGHPFADAIRFCEAHGSWTPHWMRESGDYACLKCREEASDDEVREAVEEFEGES